MDSNLYYYRGDDKCLNIPTIIETEGGKQQAMDIWSSLMRDRILMLSGPIDDTVANVVCPMLLTLEKQDPEKEIRIFINSPGGLVTAGLGIIDTMRHITCDIRTVCFGQAASMGALILSCGTKGKRSAMPLSTIMIHEPWGGTGAGKTHDVLIEAEELKRVRDVISEIMAEATGKDKDQILKDCESDRFMTADDAVEYGLIDKVTPKSQAKKEEE